MSIDSSSTSQLSSFKNHFNLNSYFNKPLQSTLSHNERTPTSRNSLKYPTKDPSQQQQQLSNSRNRTMSASGESISDTVGELTSVQTSLNKQDNKRDRRLSELKPTAERIDNTPVERRNSTPQLHLSSFFPHAFRNPKHHHKNNIKDETNAMNLTASNPNASAATSSVHFADMTNVKTEQNYLLKSPTIPMNDLRSVPLNSSERLLLSQNEDSIVSSLFIFDENILKPRSAELFIFESHTPLSVSEIYRDHFYEYFHTNYYGEFDYEGPFIASLRHIYHKTTLADTCEARAIIRTSCRNLDVSEIVDDTNENNILQTIFNKAHLPPVRAYGTIGDPKANEKIYLFDKTNDERYNCKIGIIYQRVNQTNEYDILSNDYLSNDMCEFLDRISNRISLKGFQKYRGDLDTKDDLHGDYSYYTQYENHEIMFNIAPLIPSTKINGQRVERKGLIGNSFVCIVFQEQGAIFSPDFISGKVTQIYITVQPIINDEELYYKIGIWRRNDITSIIDPPGGIYKYDKSFRPYFLTLLLNSVNVSIESPSLRSRIFEQRQRLKYEELKKLTHLFSLGPILDFNIELDSSHYSIEMRPNTRSESITSNTTGTTSDSASTNLGRVSPVSSSKKKGFSKKIFGVFSSRSGSISTPSGPSNDGIPVSPQPTSISDRSMSLGRTVIPLTKDNAQRLRSIKQNQAPVLPFRSGSSHIPHGISIQPPTPTANSSNSFLPENITQDNLVNTAALNIALRNRSNSSPEDTVNKNKIQSLLVARIDEEDHTTNSSNGEDDDEDSTDDE